MKKIKLITIAVIMLSLSGCSESDKYNDMWSDYIRSYTIFDLQYHGKGESSVSICKPRDECIYYYFNADENEEGEFEIYEVTYRPNINDESNLYSITYPDKVESIKNSDNSKTLEELKGNYQKKLHLLSVTQEELDGFMYWYRNNPDKVLN